LFLSPFLQFVLLNITKFPALYTKKNHYVGCEWTYKKLAGEIK